jgi:hypothetical protein
MTLWPDLNARSARLRPKPEEQPVMNHTGEGGGMDMITWVLIEGYGCISDGSLGRVYKRDGIPERRLLYTN